MMKKFIVIIINYMDGSNELFKIYEKEPLNRNYIGFGVNIAGECIEIYGLVRYMKKASKPNRMHHHHHGSKVMQETDNSDNEEVDNTNVSEKKKYKQKSPEHQSQNKFYTDGSYECDFSNQEFPMGYGWTTSNTNVIYNDSIKNFPSSTKAETMAILTVLLV
ncbi:hypothetical protein RhiirA4_549593 [Rhizophagus irregularis]|uniref:RNase H type-1 domain-containing protein n=1 Tax=Rhizophagus irregularis TaxID=588596 RepID=A0A2I1HEG3_9GLOM|nr:hypothetical protein RhiirA4_549593 [Rhizophagus irregularis]